MIEGWQPVHRPAMRVLLGTITQERRKLTVELPSRFFLHGIRLEYVWNADPEIMTQQHRAIVDHGALLLQAERAREPFLVSQIAQIPCLAPDFYDVTICNVPVDLSGMRAELRFEDLPGKPWTFPGSAHVYVVLNGIAFYPRAASEPAAVEAISEAPAAEEAAVERLAPLKKFQPLACDLCASTHQVSRYGTKGVSICQNLCLNCARDRLNRNLHPVQQPAPLPPYPHWREARGSLVGALVGVMLGAGAATLAYFMPQIVEALR